MKKRFFEVGIVLLATFLLYEIALYEEIVGELSEKTRNEYSGFIIGKRNMKESDTEPIEDSESIDVSEPIETLASTEDLESTEDTETGPVESIETARENAVRGYNEFLANERSISAIYAEELYIPTGEPEKRYATDYVIYDIDGDDIPELHVKNGRYYYIFTYKKGEFYVFEAYFSRPWHYYLLNDGTYVYWETYGRTDDWSCYRWDSEGNITFLASFSRTEINKNDYYDENDLYEFGGTECTMEEWLEYTNEYLYTDEYGWKHIRNEIEWTVLCEEKW